MARYTRRVLRVNRLWIVRERVFKRIPCVTRRRTRRAEINPVWKGNETHGKRVRVRGVERVVHRGVAVGGRDSNETVSVAEKTVLHVKRAPDERGVDNVGVPDGERERELTVIVFEVFALVADWSYFSMLFK